MVSNRHISPFANHSHRRGVFTNTMFPFKYPTCHRDLLLIKKPNAEFEISGYIFPQISQIYAEKISKVLELRNDRPRKGHFGIISLNRMAGVWLWRHTAVCLYVVTTMRFHGIESAYFPVRQPFPPSWCFHQQQIPV